jgi:hypothetical protein
MPENYLFPLDWRPGEDDWERALAQAKALINRYLETGERGAVLRESQGGGCGSSTAMCMIYGRSPDFTVAPDANRCLTVLREPDIIASRSAPGAGR